jgi:Xaa-Pro aminopeptidase
MVKQKSPVFVLTALDEIAWLFNLRGSDIDYNPVFFSYAIVTQDAAILFTDNQLQNGDLQYILGGQVQVQPYAAFWQKLRDMASGLKAESEEVGSLLQL